MNLLRAVLPSLVLLAFLILAVFPWGLAADTRFILPLLPATAILVMNLRRPNAVPEWMAFGAGLVLDALSAEPLGFWALVHLAAYALAVVIAPYRGTGIAARWVAGLAGVSGLALLQWTLISLYAFEPAAFAPLLQAAAILLAVYPALDILLAPFARPPESRDNGYLVRGG